MNKQNIIDAAMQIASGMGGDAHQSPVIDSDMTAEDLLRLAVRHAYKELLVTGGLSVQDVQRAFTIAVDDAGEGELPDGVLTEYLDCAFLPGFPMSSRTRYFPDFRRSKFTNLLCYWNVDGGVFRTTCTAAEESGSGVESGSGAEDEEIVFHAPGLPDIPDSPSVEIVMPQRALDAVIGTLARALRGEIRLVA